MVDSGRICTRCNTWKSAECFYQRRDKPGVLVAICRDCTKTAGRRPSRPAQTCPACNGTFQPKLKGAPATFCSQKCGAEARRFAEHGVRPARKILVVDDTKRCNKCQQWKPVTAFGLRKDRKDTPLSECRDCGAARALTYSRSDRGRDVRYAYKYGVSIEWYEAMLERQGGVCAICRQSADPNDPIHPRLVIDHCHESGAARGLLCVRCNLGLGAFGDDLGRLAEAQSYLKAFAG